jgi:putative serine protease PepD
MSDERDPAGTPPRSGPDPVEPTPDATGRDEGPGTPAAAPPLPPAESDAPQQDQTAPVWFDQTQELPERSEGSEASEPSSPPPAAAGHGWADNQGWSSDQGWASEPTGWPAAPGAPAQSSWAGPDAGGDAAAAAGSVPPPPAAAPGWEAASLPMGAPYPAAPPGPGGHGPFGPPPQDPAGRHTGPGWGAVIAMVAVAALLAAVIGGLFGGYLATHQSDLAGMGTGQSPIPTAGAGATARPSGSIASIAARALPSVVTIKVSGADGTGTGSGFFIDHSGHILTNNHVVEGAASGGSITVELSNGSTIDASIVGRDASYDLAVLKTGRSDLQPLTMGVSKDVVVGDQVIAMGAPLGLESSVTTGIVSALNRPVSPGGNGDQQSYINAIQTDAAINPGNSGGPLLDLQGHVIGINSAIARIPGATTDTQSGNIGVGFAIPSDQAVKTAEQLLRSGKAVHPVIGVILDRQYTGDGVRILAQATSATGNPVDPNGPAGKAGVKAGDIIVEFDGRPVNDPDNLVVAIRAKNVGDRVTMKVRRGSQTITVTMTLTGTAGS